MYKDFQRIKIRRHFKSKCISWGLSAC